MVPNRVGFALSPHLRVSRQSLIRPQCASTLPMQLPYMLPKRRQPRACLEQPCQIEHGSDFRPLVETAAYTNVHEDANASDAIADYSGGVPPPPSDGGSGSFGGDSGDADSSNENSEESLATLLSENNAKLSDIPSEVLTAYRKQFIPLQAISNYLIARANPISRIMLPLGPMRDRFLADRFFLLKILIEEGIGIFGKMSAEYSARRERIWKEGEFVLANLLMALLADFALVYFPAPSVSLNPVADASQKGFSVWLKKLTSGLPSNIFQTDRPFTLAQRAGGFTVKASQLFAVGFLCCFTGVLITNGLVFIRERVDPSYKPPSNKKQNPVLMSVLYATFLGLSSGTRYQLVNGIENHVFPRMFAKTPVAVEEMATFALRYANTFWGSSQWVWFARLTNVQKVE